MPPWVLRTPASTALLRSFHSDLSGVSLSVLLCHPVVTADTTCKQKNLNLAAWKLLVDLFTQGETFTLAIPLYMGDTNEFSILFLKLL